MVLLQLGFYFSCSHGHLVMLERYIVGGGLGVLPQTKKLPFKTNFLNLYTTLPLGLSQDTATCPPLV